MEHDQQSQEAENGEGVKGPYPVVVVAPIVLGFLRIGAEQEQYEEEFEFGSIRTGVLYPLRQKNAELRKGVCSTSCVTTLKERGACVRRNGLAVAA